MAIASHITKIRSSLPHLMLRDRVILSHRLKKIQKKSKSKVAHKQLLQQLNAIEKRAQASAHEREERLIQRPNVLFPENLPITAKLNDIIRTIEETQVIIISGETGSGKSTQIPKMCLEAGRGITGKIGCTQPRRIAATTIAQRIAEELGEEIGQSVGYKIRFRDKTPRNAYIKIMTDGMLLAETQRDPRLYEYDTLIIDEAHERSLNIDFLLGILKTLLDVRPELKIIITSATLDTEKFSQAFNNAPVVEVSGRMYPVEVEYMPLDPDLEETGEITYVDMAVKAVDKLRSQRRFGDILIFMPTEQDILETCERLEGRQYPETTILPLFARLPGSIQGRVYSTTGPKIVVATNVAETSLTIPNIKYVIDTGLARILRYQPSSRTTSLPISPISKSSADQRKGRCGRVQNGICIRLYSQEHYDSRHLFTAPEILRSNLAEVILRMISMKLGDIASFPFLDRPSPKSIKDGFDLLVELGAIVKDGKEFTLTEKGRVMARMPMDPKISRMIIEAQKEGCVREVAIIASSLSIQDPRERPIEKAHQADEVHAPFRDQDSDFLTFLNIWKQYHRSWKTLKTQNRMRKFCKQHFLSFPRMREWVHIHEQITTILREHKISLGPRKIRERSESLYAGIHRSILSGYLSNIAVKKEKNIYLAARGREAMIFPGSTIFNKTHPWIVAAEMVKTSRLFARTAAKIDSQWLEALGGDLCKASYSNPHWEKNRGEVRAYQQVTLYGLVIVSRRPVPYGPINPEESHKIFIQSALVEGDVKGSFPFLSHNQNLIERLTQMEDKVRRRDILVSESVMADFYSRNLAGVYDIFNLKKIIKEKGGDDFLKMREEDLLLSHPDETELAQFPDRMNMESTSLNFSYRFAPGEKDDGVTLSVPSSLVSTVSAERLEWGVPGLLREKITAMIKGLPKRYRKQVVPVSGTVDVIMEEMEQNDQSFLTALARFIYRRFGVDIPASVWANVQIPDYLKMRISVTDHKGMELESGRDIQLLRHVDSPSSEDKKSAVWREAQLKWEKTDITTWDFESLPESIPLGSHLVAYPGLEDREGSVNIRLFQTPKEALKSHKKGIQALFSIHLKKDLKFLKKDLTLPHKGVQCARYFGGLKIVENSLYRCTLNNLFYKNIRTKEEFYNHAKAIAGTMFSQGQELKNQVVKILDAYHQARSTLHTIEQANRVNKVVLSLCSQIRDEMDFLVPENFLEIYPMERLSQLPRYLKALKLRAERGANDPAKDSAKMGQVEACVNNLKKMIQGLSPHVSQEKREVVEAYRWMVEEFKVSLFAQELKTPFPVSRKRLEEKRKEIERMV